MKKILYALALSLLALPLHVKAAEPDGTKERPYVIATVEDLCNAWQLVKNFTLDDSIYFVQTADIDMAGITEWHAIMSNTKYVILYNGQNHVIRNFAPSAHSINSSENLYGTSLFGVLRGGEIKNLGVINAICGRCTGYRNSYANSGIIASFATGNSNICLNIDNVFITGTVVGEDGETGGMIGDVELNINMSNCYADVTIIGNDGSDSNWNYTGGFFGSVYNSNLNISNSYVAGSVSSTRHYTAGRIAGRSYNTSYNHVIAFNTGTYTQKENVIVATDETRASLIAEIQSWDAFNEGKINNGLPALNWQTDINNEITPDGTKEHPYEIATPEDLCNAYKLVENFAFGKELYGTPLDSIYFIQTADIDMAGIEEWHAIMGNSGKKQVSPHFIQYDGESHIIKNFAPSAQIITKTDDYYGTSLFGVLTTGEIKNLGVIDAYCGNCTNGTDNYDNPFVNSGIIISHCKDYTGVRVYIDNVFVTGTVVGKEGDTGGMIGSGGLGLFMSNCYANVNVIGSDDGLTGGLVGYAFMTHSEHITNTYVAGTVQAANADKSGLITGVSTYSCNHVVAFNKGSEKIPSDTKDVSVATDATRAELINKVQAWDAFNERKLFNGFPALNWQTEVDTPVADKTDGTKEHPYEIASAEDLCNAWTHVSGQPGTEYYFIQTADIDMAGHTDWHAISGHSGLYASIVHYDGQKHVIKNFCPQKRTVSAESNYYYSSSLFGIVSGEIKNLGVIDAYIEADNNFNGSAILAAYGGHSTAGQLTIDNVFVTGKVVSNASFTGGMLGTSGNNVIITNSYANVIVEGQSNTATLIGRPNNETTIENVYVAGSVSGDSPCLVIGAGRSQKLNVSNVVAFNTGAESASGIEVDGEIYIATEATKSQFIAEIKNWPAFNAGKMFKGYPALNWQNGEGVELGLKHLILDYNGRFLTITSPDNADIYYSVDGGDFNRYSDKFDVEGLPTISVFARKTDYPDLTPQQIKIHSYGSDTYVEIDSAGSLSEAYNWTDDVTRDNILNNPNILAFVEDNFTAESGIGRLANIIINGRADHISVSDGWPWYCPREFETTNISFSRDFTKQTAIDGGCAGWETIAVPFDVKTITHNKGVLYPFATNSNSNDHRFWLFESDAIEWQAATEIKANVPYLIAMPNNDIYAEQFNISGQVTFSAENISVPATPDNLDYVYRNGYTISANYSNRPTDDQTLVINDESVDGNAPGSCFVAGTRSARPFEAYLTAPGQSRVPIFNTSAVTEGLMAETSLKIWSDTPQSVSVSAPFNASVNIYDISGRIIRTVNVVGGQTVRITDLPVGIYIIAKNKIAIRR